MRVHSLLVVAAAIPFVACTASAPKASIELTLAESDVLTRAPAVVKVVTFGSIDGAIEKSFGEGEAPSIDLSGLATTSSIRLRVEGRAADGSVVVRGQAPAVAVADLTGNALPLFVSRTDALATLPGAFDAREVPLVGTIDDRFIFVGGGGTDSSALYDLVNLGALTTPPRLPRIPKSLVVIEASLLTLDDQSASWMDLTDSSVKEATIPTGHTTSEVSGGASIAADDGSYYIVGPTRRSATSRTVLHVAVDGTLLWQSLSSDRKGAAATFVPGTGLVVIGGNGTDPGMEILPAGAATSFLIPFAPESSEAGALSRVDATHLLFAGGQVADGVTLPDARTFDLACRANCVATSSGANRSFSHASFLTASTSLLLFAETTDGISHLFRFPSFEEIPLKTSRSHARATVINERVFITGGAATLEVIDPN